MKTLVLGCISFNIIFFVACSSLAEADIQLTHATALVAACETTP